MQAMAKLQEPSQVVQCREEDLRAVEGILPKAQAHYKSVYNSDAPQLTVDRQHFLPRGAQTQEEEDDPDHPSWCDPRSGYCCLSAASA
jgi:V-type H+-transporting ATPase subunit E